MEDVQDKLDRVLGSVGAIHSDLASFKATMTEWRKHTDQVWADRWPAVTSAIETLVRANHELTVAVTKLTSTVNTHERRLEKLEDESSVKELAHKVECLERDFRALEPERTRARDLRKALLWAGAVIFSATAGALAKALLTP